MTVRLITTVRATTTPAARMERTTHPGPPWMPATHVDSTAVDLMPAEGDLMAAEGAIAAAVEAIAVSPATP